MLARGDLGTPYFNGQPFLLKPVLIYWLIAAAFRLLSENEFAARVGSAFLGTGVVLLTYGFAARTLTRRAGFLSGLALALSYLWIDIAREASVDIPLTAALTAAVYLFFIGMRAAPRRKPWLYLPGYALLGVALLAKGPVPVGVMLCGVLAYLVGARRLRAVLAEAYVLAGIGLMLAVAAPWYGYELSHQPAFFRTFFVGEHLGHVQGELARTEPVWGNLRCVLLFFFPWAAFLPAAFVRAFQHADRGHVLRLCAWCSAAVILLFSIPASKLAHYLAPAFPALAILTGAWLDAWLEGRPVSRIWSGAAFGLIAVAGLACGAAAAVAVAMPGGVRERLAAKFGAWTPGPAPAVMLCALAVGCLAAAIAARWRRPFAVASLVGAMLVASITYIGWFGPRRAQIQAQPRKELARWLATAAPASLPVGVYYAKRNATVFYLGRPIIDLGERRDEFMGVVRFLSSPAPTAVLTHRKFVAELRQAVPGLSLWSQRDDYVVVSYARPP